MASGRVILERVIPPPGRGVYWEVVPMAATTWYWTNDDGDGDIENPTGTNWRTAAGVPAGAGVFPGSLFADSVVFPAWASGRAGSRTGGHRARACRDSRPTITCRHEWDARRRAGKRLGRGPAVSYPLGASPKL
jgi:hypothetical protein